MRLFKPTFLFALFLALGVYACSTQAQTATKIVDPVQPSRAARVTASGALMTEATAPADGVIDANNSSTTPLGANASFTGVATDLLGYASMSVSIYADQGSATEGVKIQWSNNGTNWDFLSDHTTYVAAQGNMITFGRKARYYRLVFTNGAAPQSIFRCQAILSRNSVRQTRRFIGDTVYDGDTGQVVIAALQGHTTAGGGAWVDVKVNPSGAITADATGSTVTATTTASAVAAAINTGTCADVAGSTTILAANAARKVAIILNNGAANVHVKLGVTATTANPPLAPGQSLTIDGVNVYTGVIDAIAASGTQNVCVYAW